ncbi:MAG: hypothetical protein ABH956_01305 [Candidatus Nealsonbacteria bacterium]
MDFKTVNKIILIFGLLLVIIGTGTLLNRSDIGKDYFGWVKSVLSNLNPLKAGITLNSPITEESKLNYTDVNLDELNDEQDEINQVDQLDNLSLEINGVSKENTPVISTNQVDVLPVKEITLPEIEQTINVIAQKTKQIEQEIDKLVVLEQVKQEIILIVQELKEIGNNVKELKVSNEEQIDSDNIVEETNQEVVEPA